MKTSVNLMALLGVLFGKKTFAVTTTAATAGLSAQLNGFDPLPWIVATAGMVYMLARSEPDPSKDVNRQRKDALANGLVSLVFGGLGGPFTAAAIGIYFDPRLESPLLMAFLISAFWQVVAYKIWPAIWPILKGWLQRKAGG